MKAPALLLFLFLHTLIFGQSTISFYTYSHHVKDSFELFITLPDTIDAQAAYATVYYLDANLKSGEKLRQLLAVGDQRNNTAHAIFVGIGHPNGNKALRKRDFIISSSRNYFITRKLITRKPKYGHADNFYNFLKEELIPQVESQYKVNGNRTIIGHSYGGLFASYCLFQSDPLFSNFVLLSPSFWVNRYKIFDLEKEYCGNYDRLNAYVYLSAGNRETINLILGGTRKMSKLLMKREYRGLTFDYFEHKGKDHNTQVPISLSYVLQCIRF